MERYKVFLVEDDEVICQSLTRQLEGWGYEVCPVQRSSSCTRTLC